VLHDPPRPQLADVALRYTVCCLGCSGVGVEGFGRRQGEVFSGPVVGSKCICSVSCREGHDLVGMFLLSKYDHFAENCVHFLNYEAVY